MKVVLSRTCQKFLMIYETYTSMDIRCGVFFFFFSFLLFSSLLTENYASGLFGRSSKRHWLIWLLIVAATLTRVKVLTYIWTNQILESLLLCISMLGRRYVYLSNYYVQLISFSSSDLKLYNIGIKDSSRSYR